MSEKIISHAADRLTNEEKELDSLRTNLLSRAEGSGTSTDGLVKLFDQLCKFDLGRFILLNKGLNAYWTDQIVSWTPNHSRQLSPLESTIFAELPTTLATRERYMTFRRELKKLMRSGVKMLSVPCGFMSDLLDLQHIDDAFLTGVDLDQQALDGAKENFRRLDITAALDLRKEDAWQINLSNEFDVVTSNGLNIYEHDDNKVLELYRVFHRALRDGGVLITSFMTPPPSIDPDSSWRMDRLDPKLLQLQKTLFSDVIQANWTAFRSERKTRAQLEAAGFTVDRFIYDTAGLFPTVIATKTRFG